MDSLFISEQQMEVGADGHAFMPLDFTFDMASWNHVSPSTLAGTNDDVIDCFRAFEAR